MESNTELKQSEYWTGTFQMCMNSPLNERVYRLLNLLSGPEKIITILSNFVRKC